MIGFMIESHRRALKTGQDSDRGPPPCQAPIQINSYASLVVTAGSAPHVVAPTPQARPRQMVPGLGC